MIARHIQPDTPVSIRRRGSAYVLVIGTALFAAILSVGALVTGRAQARALAAGDSTSTANFSAQSGIALARNWINQDVNWRANRTSGTWATDLSLGTGSVTINVVDTVDGNLANRPYDPVTITATGTNGAGRQAMSVTLQAQPIPLPILAYALSTPGQVHIRPSKSLRIFDGTMFTSGTLRNENTLEGNAEVGSFNLTGLIYGSKVTGAAAKTMPASTIPESYASLGTPIVLGSLAERFVLAPSINPWGSANADGVYVVRSSVDLVIKHCRVIGTLVVICPGKKVRIAGNVNWQPSRSDYPVLIVDGNLEFDYGNGNLNENGQATNFNPVGAAYQGVTDNDQVDSFPSEIRGLVHVTGTAKFVDDSIVRGAVIVGSNATTDAVDISANGRIYYDSTLFTSPPQFYTTSVPMIQSTSTWKRKVD